MATEAQIEANRRNAQKSTGPRTEEGRQNSSRNATKSGLFSRHVLLPGEDEDELESLRDGIRARLKPADALEEVYVERIVATTWRLQRALSGEGDIFARHKRSQAILPSADIPVAQLEGLQRHIAALERSLDKALTELSKLQKLRRESADDQNEPNLGAAEEKSASSTIAIVKMNPILEVQEDRSQEAGNSENEPNSPNAPGGGAFPAPTPDSIEPAVGLCPSASMQEEHCG